MPTSIGSTPGYTQENSEITTIPIDEGLYAWLPVDISNTWIYSYTAYINSDHATWRVSDTVIDVQERSGYTIARIQREVTLISDQTSVNFPDEPVSGEYWYLTNGSYLYKQTGSLDPDAITDSWLELVYPISPGVCWYPDPAQRSDMAVVTPSPGVTIPGCRYVAGEPINIETLSGLFETCYSIITTYNSGSTIITFCPGIGIVGWKYDHLGTHFGYEAVIIGYSMDLP
jgi:hypothetical protein